MKPQPSLLPALLLLCSTAAAASGSPGLRGEPEAIAEARAMVETMGGIDLWSQLGSVHFVHEWQIWNRIDSYVENEILDLTAPRSWVEMKSEIYHRLRAYSPEYGYWNVVDGEFSRVDDEALAAALERAPYNICRIAHAIAVGDPDYEIRHGTGELPGIRQLEFYGPDGQRHGWIALNARNEPIIWATTQYRYVFGPLERYGNLRFPRWGSTGEGKVSFETLSLTGDRERPDPDLFAPPERFVADAER